MVMGATSHSGCFNDGADYVFSVKVNWISAIHQSRKCLGCRSHSEYLGIPLCCCVICEQGVCGGN